MRTLGEHMGVRVIPVDAEQRFLDALRGETDPERKRKIIGRLFVEVFDEEAHRLEGVRWLAQGTIYPDVIESAGAKTGKAHVIKSHHNVGGLPEQMKLKLVEPLRELFKDEVRRLGLELGLPRSMVFRHPFPGPGLGVRILGEVTRQYADLLRRADRIFFTVWRPNPGTRISASRGAEFTSTGQRSGCRSAQESLGSTFRSRSGRASSTISSTEKPYCRTS